MKHTKLVSKPIAKVAEVLKSEAKMLDTTTSEDYIGQELVYSTFILNHRQYVLIEKAGEPVMISFGRGDRKRTITKPIIEDFSMCYDQFQGETHGY